MTEETETPLVPGPSNGEQALQMPPDEPFACPNCGQMLAPECRVCVACREPVDFSKVRSATVPAPIEVPERAAEPAPAPRGRAQFSWVIFAISVVAYFVVVSGAEHLRAKTRVGPFWAGLAAAGALSAIGAVWLYREHRGDRLKRAIAWAAGFFFASMPCYVAINYGGERLLRSSHLTPLEQGLWIQSAIQVACAVWIFFDATTRHIPRRLRWALGSFLIWIIVFPWYLSRRRTPGVHCLVMEAPGRAFGWTVVWLILLYAVLGMFLASLHVLPK